jgi:hypothetical protein
LRSGSSESDEGLKRGGEIFPILGEALVSAEPGEGSLDDPAAP